MSKKIEEETKDLTTQEENTDMATLSNELGFDVKENMDDVKISFPEIKIAHQENQFFVFPGKETKADFEGIVIYSHLTNGWWRESFANSGGSAAPDCFSLDGHTPDPASQDAQAKRCDLCELNVFGSGLDDKGNPTNGKACKNMRAIYIVAEGSKIPYRMLVPATSLKAWDAHMNFLTSQGIPSPLAVVRFALVQKKSQTGIKFSMLTIELLNEITSMQKGKEIKKLRDKFLELFKSQPIISDGEDQDVSEQF